MWREAAAAMQEVLQAAVARTGVWMWLEGLAQFPREGFATCILVHANAYTLQELQAEMERLPHSVWIIASGGSDVFASTLAPLRVHPRVAGFPLVYGRERELHSWFHAWMRENFSLEAFAAVAPELTTPTHDLPPNIARRLGEQLLPLRIILGGYAHIRETGDAGRAWLARSIALQQFRLDAGDVEKLRLQLKVGSLRASLQAVANLQWLERIESGVATDEEVAASIAEVDAVVGALTKIADGRPEAGALWATPVEQVRTLRSAIGTLREALEREEDVLREARTGLFTVAARDALVELMTAAAPPYDERKQVVRRLHALRAENGQEATTAACRSIEADLGLLCWLAESGTYPRVLAGLSHDLINNSLGQAVTVLCDYHVRARARGIEIPDRMKAQVSGAVQRWGVAQQIFAQFEADVIGRFGFVPTGRFGEEMRLTRILAETIPARLAIIDSLDDAGIMSIRSDIIRVSAFFRALSVYREFGEYFADVDASMLEEGHDALA